MVGGGYIAVMVGTAKHLEFIEAFFPRRGMGIPDESNASQRFHALVSHVGRLTRLHELVLVALAFDPAG